MTGTGDRLTDLEVTLPIGATTGLATLVADDVEQRADEALAVLGQR